MKPRLLIYGIGVSLLFMLMACAGEDTDKLTTPVELTVEKAKSDSTAMHCLALDYQVADFATWKKAFEENDSLRKSFGLRLLYLFRKMPDANRVLIMLEVADVDKASEFGANPEVLSEMKEQGVVGAPSITILNAVHLSVKSKTTSCILLQHEVDDYKNWVKGFDEAMTTDEGEGIRALCRFYVLDNPTMVSVLMEVKSFELAERIVSSEENISALKQSGAISEPIMTLLTYVK